MGDCGLRMFGSVFASGEISRVMSVAPADGGSNGGGDGTRYVIVGGGPAGVAVVVDDEKNPIGVVTKGQLGVALRVTRRVREVSALQCMSKDFSLISKDVIVDEAESMMRNDEVKFLIAVDADGCYAGIYKHEDA